MDSFQVGSQTRDKAAVQAPGKELSLDSVLALVQGLASGLVESGPQTEPVLPAEEGCAAMEDGDSNSSSEEEAPGLSFFGPAPKAKAAAKDAAKPKGSVSGSKSQASAPAQPKQSQPKPSKGLALVAPGPKAKSAPTPSDDGSATLLADGRAQRALRNLRESVAKWKDELAKVKVDDEPPAPDLRSQSSWKQECNNRVATAKNLARQAREYNKRMEKSSNKDFFGEDLAQLQAVEAAAGALQTLFTAFSAPNSVPDDMVTAYEACVEHVALLQSDALGTCFQLKYVVAKASRSCLYGDYSKYCQHFLSTDESLQSLVASLGTERVTDHVTAEVESRLLLSLKGVTLQECQAMAAGEEVASIQECAAFCQAVVSTAKTHGRKFLASGLESAADLALGLVSTSDISLTQRSIKDMEQVAEDAKAEKGLAATAFLSFFLAHAVGKALLDLATSRVTTGAEESETADAFKALQERIQELQATGFAGAVVGMKLISDTLQPVQKVLDLCSQKLATLKQSKAKGDSSNLKQKSRAHDRFMDSFTSYKASFVECAKSLLQAELKSNLTQHLIFGGNWFF